MATYRIYNLNDVFEQVGELENVRAISVTKSITDAAPLLASCSVEFDTAEPAFSSRWVEIDAIEGAKRVLGVFNLSEDSRTENHGRWTVTASGCSVLSIPASEQVEVGAFAREGEDVGGFLKEMLASLPSLEVLDSAKIPATVVFDAKATRLEAAWNVLDMIGWRLRLDGSKVCAEEMPDAGGLRITWDDNHGMHPGIKPGAVTEYTRNLDDETEVGDLAEIYLGRYGLDVGGRVLTQSVRASANLMVTETVGNLERGTDD